MTAQNNPAPSNLVLLRRCTVRFSPFPELVDDDETATGTSPDSERNLLNINHERTRDLRQMPVPRGYLRHGLFCRNPGEDFICDAYYCGLGRDETDVKCLVWEGTCRCASSTQLKPPMSDGKGRYLFHVNALAGIIGPCEQYHTRRVGLVGVCSTHQASVVFDKCWHDEFL
jgi:hypothetical protein